MLLSSTRLAKFSKVTELSVGPVESESPASFIALTQFADLLPQDPEWTAILFLQLCYYSANLKGDIKQRIWLLDVERKN